MHYRCYQVNDSEPDDADDGHPGSWFHASIAAFIDEAPGLERQEYDYIVVIESREYSRYPFGNLCCAQGYRHRTTGWAFPDRCRQQGGCPEIWHTRKRRQLKLAHDSPIVEYIYSPS